MRINFVEWKINIRLISIKNNTTYVEMICIKAKKVASPKRLCYHYHAHTTKKKHILDGFFLDGFKNRLEK
jgi:hypothetical protein